MQYTIRDANEHDASVIAEFNSRLAAETEEHSLDPNLIGPGVASLLADPGKGRYWVAIQDGSVIAQIMVTYEWSDWRNGLLWWIQSVYVQQEHRRSGVFSSLYRHVETLAQASNAIGIRLYVEENNVQAQKTYRALGMVDPHYRVMESVFGDAKC